MVEAPTSPRHVSVAEAAVILGVSVDTVKRRVRSGALHSIRTAQGRVLVSLPEEEPAPHAAQEPPSASRDAGQVQGSDPDVAALLERVAAMTAERDWLRERVERAESEREQLRILLSNAQQSLVRALQAAPRGASRQAQAGPGEPEPVEPIPEPSSSFPAPLPPTPNVMPGWRRAWTGWPWLLLVLVMLVASAWPHLMAMR
jgi:excisionase family DNA binding protein